jgi:hypothetical protein
MKNIIKYSWSLLLFAVLLPACEDSLDVIPPGEFAPGNVLQKEAGLTALLYSAYEYANYASGPMKDIINMTEVCTDMAFNTGGGENRTLSLLIDFTWDPSVDWFRVDFWVQPYNAIRDANIVLENLERADISDAVRRQFQAEARFIRAMEYADLYNWFGTVPLRTSSEQPAELPRASEAEMLSFIESELEAAIPDLPMPGEEPQYGRANQGAALGILTKFLLNSKQWQKTADAAQRLINLNYYELYPVYREMFRVENEGNRQMIFVHPALNEPAYGCLFPNGAYPPGFKSSPKIPEFTWTSAMANWATQYRLRDAFVDSYDRADARFGLIIEEYENQGGNMVNLRNQVDNARSLKYFDNNQTANFSGNDYPRVRYSDILLSRAEALNELNGPTQEALDLINAVRARAGIAILTTAEATSKEVFRDLILQERGWEFVSEAKRREDLIRHGKFISRAQDRGINAQPHHVLFPIPEAEIVANPAVEQNPGYSN